MSTIQRRSLIFQFCLHSLFFFFTLQTKSVYNVGQAPFNALLFNPTKKNKHHFKNPFYDTKYQTSNTFNKLQKVNSQIYRSSPINIMGFSKDNNNRNGSKTISSKHLRMNPYIPLVNLNQSRSGPIIIGKADISKMQDQAYINNIINKSYFSVAVPESISNGLHFSGQQTQNTTHNPNGQMNQNTQINQNSQLNHMISFPKQVKLN